MLNRSVSGYARAARAGVATSATSPKKAIALETVSEADRVAVRARLRDVAGGRGLDAEVGERGVAAEEREAQRERPHAEALLTELPDQEWRQTERDEDAAERPQPVRDRVADDEGAGPLLGHGSPAASRGEC